MPDTLLLTRSEVAALLDGPALIAALRPAFAAYSRDRRLRAQRFPVPLPTAPAGSSGMLLAPGLLLGVPAYTVKVNAKFPHHAPAISGLVVLHDLATGRLLAVMDSTHLTAVRTAALSMLAADVLARPGAGDVALIGAGAQAALQASLLSAVRTIRRVRVFDTAPGRAEAFCREHTVFQKPPGAGLRPEPAATVADAVAGADWIITATWATQPFLFPGMVAPGAHITSIGPDQAGKCEVSADLLRQARFFCDDRDLCLSMGAAAGAGLGAEAIHGELGEVIASTVPGRTSPQDITVFGTVGLAVQDLAAAWQVYQRAQEQGVGRTVDWLG
jgi:ornithine cyclodeaminase